MRVLGHIHTLNDEQVIERSLAALRAQTRPLDAIVVVDNGSTDGTLARLAGQPIQLIRHAQNLGTSGSVVSGFRHALDGGFDWIWLFDADTAARPDALEKLLALHAALDEDTRRQTWLLSSFHVERGGVHPCYQHVFTRTGYRNVRPDPEQPVAEFDSTIWSGALYRIATVREIGVPSIDYVLDWGEHEYGYRGRRHGYRAFLDQRSVVEHNIGEEGPALQIVTHRIGPFRFRARDLPPIRCYYLVRNWLIFWIWDYGLRSPLAIAIGLARVLKLTLSFAVRGRSRRAQTIACLRGLSDGLLNRIERRYAGE
jgi:GT2 family glycosyltransferase